MQIAYFASDFHLGVPDKVSSLKREKEIVAWLDFASTDATDIYLVGDVFDFWFEYAMAIPKGFTRLLGKIAQLSDQGIQFHFFKGNHDMWTRDYFQEELNMKVYSHPVDVNFHSKKYMIGHGDGLGPGDRGYKLVKGLLRSKACQWLFERIHPNFGIRLASSLSQSSRKHTKDEKLFFGFENEWLYLFAKETLLHTHYDFFIFGHRHFPMALKLENSTYINLGEWLHFKTFLKIENNHPEMYQWKDGKAITYNPFDGSDV